MANLEPMAAPWREATHRPVALGPVTVERDEKSLLMSVAATDGDGRLYDVGLLPTGGEFFHDQPSEWTFLSLSIDGTQLARTGELTTEACEAPGSDAVVLVESLAVPVSPPILRIRAVCLLASTDPEEPGWWVGAQTWLVRAGAVLWESPHAVILAPDAMPWRTGGCHDSTVRWRIGDAGPEARVEPFDVAWAAGTVCDEFPPAGQPTTGEGTVLDLR